MISLHRLWSSIDQTHFLSNERFKFESGCGPMPNVMAALPNTGGALLSKPQSLADAHY